MGISRYHSFGRREEGGKGKKKAAWGNRKEQEQSQCQKCDGVVGWILLVTVTTQGGNMATIDSPKGSPACIVLEKE